MNHSRPLSPHLQIYRLPITAWLSITHRITGILLFIGALFVVAGLVILATGPEYWQPIHAALSSFPGRLLLSMEVFALNYHLCNGIRHLLWDIGIGLKYEAAYKSGLVMLATALLLTFFTLTLAFA